MVPRSGLVGVPRNPVLCDSKNGCAGNTLCDLLGPTGGEDGQEALGCCPRLAMVDGKGGAADAPSGSERRDTAKSGVESQRGCWRGLAGV